MQDAKVKKAMRDQEADQQSLDRAADLEEIYDEMLWVHEMPEPKKQRGRRVKPDSREQFAKWVAKTYGWKDPSARISQLHKAHEVLPILLTRVRGIRPTGEKTLRPLGKLREQGYEDHQAEVWEEAVKIAQGTAPTHSQVTKAVNEFLERHKPPIRNLATNPKAAEEKRAARDARLVASFVEILEENNREASEVLDEMFARFNAHQAVLREEVSV
jgi:hypothetical protein